MRVQTLAALLLGVALLCAEGAYGASLAGASQHKEEARGESKAMVKREAEPLGFVCYFCYNCCPENPGFGLCCKT